MKLFKRVGCAAFLLAGCSQSTPEPTLVGIWTRSELTWTITPLGGASSTFHETSNPPAYQFEANGTFTYRRSGQPITAGTYGYSGTTLTIRYPNNTRVTSVEELSARRLVLLETSESPLNRIETTETLVR